MCKGKISFTSLPNGFTLKKEVQSVSTKTLTKKNGKKVRRIIRTIKVTKSRSNSAASLSSNPDETKVLPMKKIYVYSDKKGNTGLQTTRE